MLGKAAKSCCPLDVIKSFWNIDAILKLLSYKGLICSESGTNKKVDKFLNF